MDSKDIINRRRFLKIGGIGAAGAAGIAAIGCGDSKTTEPPSNNNPGGPPGSGIPALDVDRGVPFTPETLVLTPGSTTEEINLNWYSDDAAGLTSSMARFIDDENQVITGSGVISPASTGKRFHKVTVTGLKPDTWYSYSVSNNGVDWSYEYSYKTPKTNGFRFAVIGDPQLTQMRTSGQGKQDATSTQFSTDETTAQGWKDTMAKVGAAGVNFVAGVGDQVDVTSNGDEQEYRHFMAPPEFKSIPWAPAVGNHDRHYPFQYHYNLPNELEFDKLQSADYGNATNEQYAVVEAAGNYYYLYNNTLFVVLNTSAYPTSTEAAASIVDRFDETLTAAKAANPGYTWLFVQHHKSTASVADHCADRDIQYYVEAGFEELMTTHGVDFVLAGHDHVYARSFPLTGKKGHGIPSEPDTLQGGNTITNPNGTIYVTLTTGSGLKYYDLYNWSGNLYVKDNEYYPYLVGGEKGSVMYAGSNIGNSTASPNEWVRENDGLLPVSNVQREQEKRPQYTVVDVVGNTVTFTTYDTYGDAIRDSFTVTK